jgi:pectinesterase
VYDASADSATLADAGSEAGTSGAVQAAIDLAVAAGGTSRVYIRVPAGTYREVVCVPPSAPPITLYSTNADPTQTVIVFNHYNGLAKPVGAPANPCTSNATGSTYGTAGSATFSAFAKGFQAKNITFSNDATVYVGADGGVTSGTQAVALMTEADQVILENVRVLGHQDTLYAETPNSDTVIRTYVKNSYVAGDVDFIFGAASLVLDSPQIQFVSDRRAVGNVLAKGNILSPSTDSRSPYGILVTSGSFMGDANTAPGGVSLGRAWDRNCGANAASYLTTCVAVGHYPNGQAVVRNSTLGGHITAGAWAASATTGRAFCNTDSVCVADAGVNCPADRLYEYQNRGPGAAATPDAGASADAGTSADGGASADAGDSGGPACTIARPQLNDMQAVDETVLKYLAQAGSLAAGLATDNWDPTAGIGDVTTFTATYTVGAP